MDHSLAFLNELDWNNHDGINFPMINDFMRNQFYDNILRDNVKNKHCLDIGFGTGLLSILALKHGAKSIVAYEIDQNRYQLGLEIIKQMGLENKITLICGFYQFDDFKKHHAQVVFTETVNGGLWNEGLWRSLPRASGVQFLPGRYYLDICAVEIPYNFAAELTTSANQLHFAPGVNIDPEFIDCVNRVSNKTGSILGPIASGFTVLSNTDTVWGWMPYMRLAAYNSKIIAGYIVDAVESTVTVTDSSGTCVSAIDFNTRQFTLDVDTSSWQDRCMLLVPRVSMAHGDNKLILDTGHWGPARDPVIIKNIKNNVKIVHSVRNGIVTYDIA